MSIDPMVIIHTEGSDSFSNEVVEEIEVFSPEYFAG
ncbi:hypothetical protein CFELI_07675 [Corynebacterium felinum]|uniref:Uncharacterized protein n=1 Tax=Corynebacterium felinum TaxID=131318 RepID=A0ABU2BB20_9CORY|nr:hypothetical protein [Corynebacterium felinum]WJY95149.1 hypothetical protein CFELI_07675 [Corynebacterium felinum]